MIIIFSEAQKQPPEVFYKKCSLRQKCPNTEFFWSIFSRIRIEYGEIREIFKKSHSVKNVQIRSFSWSVFPRIRTECVFSPNAGKYWPEKTLYFDTFHAVVVLINFAIFTGEDLCWSLFLIKFHVRYATFLKKDSNIAKFLRTSMFVEMPY